MKLLKFLLQLAACVCVAGAVHVQGQTLFWRTDGTSGTWTASNWNSGSANATGGTAYTANSDVDFSATSTVTFATVSIGNVTVDANQTVVVTQAGTLSMNGAVRTFDIGSGATLTWTGQTVTANSAAGITKNGTGTLNLGALTFTTNMNGGFTLNAGTVIVTGAKALGNGALTINGGTLTSSGTIAFAPTSLTIGGDFTLGGSGASSWAANVALGSSTRTITNVTTGGSRVFSGVVSGNAGLTLAGAGSGTVNITGTANTFTGAININGAETVFAADGSLGNSANTLTIDGGRFTATGSYTLAAGRNLQVGSTAGTSISAKGTGTVLTYNGVIADKTSGGILVKQGASTLALGGVSTYTGDTSINNGTVQLTTGNDRLPTGTTVNLGQAASANTGILDLNGFSQQVAGLNSTTGTGVTTTNSVTSATAATLTLGGSGSYSYGDGSNANSGIITGSIAIVKSGSGTQTLGDANTYTGTTTITGGTLAINGSLAAGSAVAVNSGGTLAGTGTVNGATTLASGGAIAPGGATPGTLTLAGLTVVGGGTVNVSLVRDTLATDHLVLTGILNISALTSGSKLNLTLTGIGGTFDDSIDHTFASVVTFASLTGTFAADKFNLDTTAFGQAFAGSFALLQNGLTAFDLQYTAAAVPEPAAYAALFGALALGGAAWSRRRRTATTRAARPNPE